MEIFRMKKKSLDSLKQKGKNFVNLLQLEETTRYTTKDTFYS